MMSLWSTVPRRVRRQTHVRAAGHIPETHQTELTGFAFFPFPDLGTSVHISFTFSNSL
jgi:hypothetical protein